MYLALAEFIPNQYVYTKVFWEITLIIFVAYHKLYTNVRHLQSSCYIYLTKVINLKPFVKKIIKTM
jgi:hypothetical protein